ncbi:MAG: acyl-CoA dehydrogenase family protein, partial [Betaproteobacteria bacterium]|nr:acyl-CoA dehydrogenase family protein [Betaproteobacteria bacterium]
MIRDPETFNILLDTLRRFVRERLIPAEQQLVDSDEIPPAIIAEMREMGLFGLTIPVEYGGLGLTTEEEALTSMEMCRAS